MKYLYLLLLEKRTIYFWMNFLPYVEQFYSFLFLGACQKAFASTYSRTFSIENLLIRMHGLIICQRKSVIEIVLVCMWIYTLKYLLLTLMSSSVKYVYM